MKRRRGGCVFAGEDGNSGKKRGVAF